MAVREVSKAPGMLGLYVRAALPLVPGASKVPGLPVPKGRELPDLELVLRDAHVERRQLDAYREVCGFDTGHDLPATYPHILAFPLHMALMTDGSFPFAPVGLVHIENRVTVHRPIGDGEALSLRVFPGRLEPHPKGRKFSIVTQAHVADELVWEETSTMLRRGSGSDSSAAGDEPARGTQASASAEWQLPADTGRRYAGVSGDRNPIHLYDVTAKLFGFPRAIAHGMWTKARCLAAMGAELPETFTVDVAFRKPILLPATVEFAVEETDAGERRFSVRDAKKGASHLDGALTAT
jgi:acyl dehydratase